MYILNQSIGCQSSPLSIIAFLHLHAIVLPISCGGFLGLSFHHGGVVESPKTLTSLFMALVTFLTLKMLISLFTIPFHFLNLSLVLICQS